MSQDPGALKESIRLYYAEFGRDVAALVATELVDKGGFELLLPKLGLIDPLDNSARYHALHAFLKTKGPDALLRKISGLGEDFKIQSADTRSVTSENDRRLTDMALRDARVKKERAAATGAPSGIDPILPPQRGALEPKYPGGYPTPMNPISATPAVQPGAASTPIQPAAANTPIQPGATATPMQPGAAQTPAQASVKVALQTVLPTPGIAPTAPGMPQQWPVLFSGPLRTGTPPLTGTFTNTPAWDSSKPYDPNGTWPEVERRNGIERRIAADRRGDVELIFKNRRFGKDRRSKIERRKGWPTKGFIKPDGSKP
jgi:hypothetical protein